MTHEIYLYISKANKVFDCDIMQDNRKGNNVIGRIAIGNFMRKNLKMTFQKVADEMYKNHATIIHYCKQHANLMDYNKEYRQKYNDFVKENKPSLIFCNQSLFKIQKINYI
jgi:chromosomal replication initiation ATPase DnaA